MNQTTTSSTNPKNAEQTAKKPGFFGRILQKIDASMKQKAEQKSKSDCCGGDNSKGGKCC